MNNSTHPQDDAPTGPNHGVDPADLLASVAIRLDRALSELSTVVHSLNVVVGQVRSLGMRLTSCEERIASLEQGQTQLEAELLSLREGE